MTSNWYARFIKSMIGDIAQADGISVSDFQGCTEAELHQLMQVQNVQRLPEMYRQFMLQVGKGFAARQDDMLWTFAKMLKFEKASHGLINENVFVFMWQYADFNVFFGFSTKEFSDNPNVLTWNENMLDEDEMVVYHDSITLSEFLVDFFAPE